MVTEQHININYLFVICTSSETDRQLLYPARQQDNRWEGLQQPSPSSGNSPDEGRIFPLSRQGLPRAFPNDTDLVDDLIDDMDFFD